MKGKNKIKLSWVDSFLVGFFIAVGFFILALSVLNYNTDIQATPEQITTISEPLTYNYLVLEKVPFHTNLKVDVIEPYGVNFNLESGRYESYVFYQDYFQIENKTYIKVRR
jgi:hypothetical protein